MTATRSATARALRRSDLRAPEAQPRPRPRPDLRIVRPDERPRRRSTKVFTGVLVAIVFLALFGLLMFQTVLVQSQSQIDDLDQQIDAQQEQIEKRQLEITELESPERVIDEATSTLGMIAPPDVPMIEEVPGGEAPLGDPVPTAADRGRAPKSAAVAGR